MLNRAVAWFLMGVGVVVSTPWVFRLSEAITSQLLVYAVLDVWNAGNWISGSCALIATLLYIVCCAQIVHFATNPALRGQGGMLLDRVVFFVLVVGVWLGFGIVLPILFPVFSPSITFVTATLLCLPLCAVFFSPTLLGIPTVIRGYKLRRAYELYAPWRWKYTRWRIPWGAAFVRKENETLHFLLIGNTGSGKSTFLEVMMARTLRGVGFNPNYRAIIVDAKGDLVPYLEALGLRTTEGEPLYVILNPLDKRAVRWAIAKDIDTAGKAGEFAAVFLPERKENTQFFRLTATTLLTAGVVALQRAKPERWSFRDLINAFSSARCLKALIEKWHPRPHDFEEYFKTRKDDRNDIFMTVKAELDHYWLIAACWENAQGEFSIHDWEQREYVLVLGSDYSYPETIKKINRLLFTFIAACLKQMPDDPERRVWLFIDELIATGKLVAFEELLQLGRSKSVCMVSSVLNISSFTKEFGEHTAKSILGLSRHKALFPMDSESAQYMSKCIGEHEEIGMSYSPRTMSLPGEGLQSASITYRREKRVTVLPQELDDRNLPQPGPRNGLTGYFILPGEGVHCHTYSWKTIEQWRPRRVDNVVAYDRINERDERFPLKDWTKEEQREFGVDNAQGEQGTPHKPPPNKKK